MSKTLAFTSGIAIITVIFWLLFSPAPAHRDGGIPRAGALDTPADQIPEADQPVLTADSHPDPQEAPYEAPATRSEEPHSPLVPDPVAEHQRTAPPRITLWQPVPGGEQADADGFPATRLQTDPGLPDTFHVGQELVIDIPDLQQPLTARLETTHNQLDTVQVFRGPVIDGGEYDNVIVTRGESATYVVVSTSESVWSAVIDHSTGETLLTDERDILVRRNHDDYIPVPGIDQEPPSPENTVN